MKKNKELNCYNGRMLPTGRFVFQSFTNLFFKTKYCLIIQIFPLSFFKIFSFFVSESKDGKKQAHWLVVACLGLSDQTIVFDCEPCYFVDKYFHFIVDYKYQF